MAPTAHDDDEAERAHALGLALPAPMAALVERVTQRVTPAVSSVTPTTPATTAIAPASPRPRRRYPPPQRASSGHFA